MNEATYLNTEKLNSLSQKNKDEQLSQHNLQTAENPQKVLPLSISSNNSNPKMLSQNSSNLTISKAINVINNDDLPQNTVKKQFKNGVEALKKRKKQYYRIRKSENQIQLLIQEFKKFQEWTKEKVAELSERTGLSESQVYKWNWDQRKKFALGIENLEAEVARDEFGGYCCKTSSKIPNMDSYEESDNENDFSGLVGYNVEEVAINIVRADLEKKKSTSSPCSLQLHIISPNKKSQNLSPDRRLILVQTPQQRNQILTPQQSSEQENKIIQQKFLIEQNAKRNNGVNSIKAFKLEQKPTELSLIESWIVESQNSFPVFEESPQNLLSPLKLNSSIDDKAEEGFNLYTQTLDNFQSFQKQSNKTNNKGNLQSQFTLKMTFCNNSQKNSPNKSPFKQLQYTQGSPFNEEEIFDLLH